MGISGILARNIMLLREKKGYSQKELATIANCSQATIAKIENGQGFVSAELADKLAAALGVHVSRLFYCPQMDFSEEISEVFDSLLRQNKKAIQEAKSLLTFNSDKVTSKKVKA